jgi:hypothetical protein
MELSEELVQQVWENARATSDQDPRHWRKDECGAWMRREHYGHTYSEFDWKIDNASIGGADVAENLRAFHHANSYDRAERRPHCHVTADMAHVPTPERVLEPRNRKV